MIEIKGLSMSRVKSSAVLASLAVAGLLVAAGSAQATTFSFNVTGGCSEACAANALITPGAGTLHVVLSDTQADPRSAGDLVSSLEMVTNAVLAGTSLTAQAGSLLAVPDDPPNNTAVGVAGDPTHWHASGAGSTIELTTIGGGKPINMIIGPPGVGGNYPSANGSITTAGFDPFISGAGTFDIADAAITADTVVTSVSFNFGTGPDTILPGVPCMPGTPNCGSGPPLIPEPGTLALLGSALAALGFYRRRKSA
jgi:hypothetical protein